MALDVEGSETSNLNHHAPHSKIYSQIPRQKGRRHPRRYPVGWLARRESPDENGERSAHPATRFPPLACGSFRE